MTLAGDLDEVLRALEEAGTEHMVVGGLALDALGLPRATIDIDIQVLTHEPPRKDRSVLFGCIVEEWSRDEVFGQETLIAHLGTSAVPVEFFYTSHWLPLQALRRRRRVPSPMLGRDIPIPAPEDFVLLKAAYLAAPTRSVAKRAQDALDIEHVAAAAELDLAYVRGSAQRLGLWPALEPLLLRRP